MNSVTTSPTWLDFRTAFRSDVKAAILRNPPISTGLGRVAMAIGSDSHYFHKPTGAEPLPGGVEFVAVSEFLADEAACTTLWELLDTQFRTRSKFLSIWPSVRFVCLHRDAEGGADGFLLVSAPVNWQIDYVVVRPDSRGQGIAQKIVKAALSQAYLHQAPYVMLTCKDSLRPLYEGCGFSVINAAAITV